MENQIFQELFNSKEKNQTFNNKDFFKYYRSIFGKTKGLYLHEYSNIVSDFFEKVSEELFKPNYRVRLPFNSGEVYLLKHKSKVLTNENGDKRFYYPIDWYETNKLWEEDVDAKNKKILVRHTNDHTGGYVYKIKYKLPNRFDSGRSLIRFIPSRFFKIKFSKYLKNNNGYLNCDMKEFFTYNNKDYKDEQ